MSHQNPFRIETFDTDIFNHIKRNAPKTATIPEYFSLGLLADIF